VPLPGLCGRWVRGGELVITSGSERRELVGISNIAAGGVMQGCVGPPRCKDRRVA